MKRFKLIWLALSLFPVLSFAASTATPTPTALPTAVSTPTANDTGVELGFLRSYVSQLNTLTRAIYTSVNSIGGAANAKALPTAWVQADITNQTTLINASMNTASLTGGGTGVFTWTFNDAMSNTCYAILATASASAVTVTCKASVSSRAVGSCVLRFVSGVTGTDDVVQNPTGINAAVFGGK
jgi:hypothetical protein